MTRFQLFDLFRVLHSLCPSILTRLTRFRKICYTRRLWHSQFPNAITRSRLLIATELPMSNPHKGL